MAYRILGATDARGGEIILRRPWQKIVFMSGLFGGIVLLALAVIIRF